MFSGINNNNFSFFHFSNLSFIVFGFTTSKKNILYFKYNWKRDTITHKRTYMGLYDKLKNRFLINSNSFQRKHKIIATPYILQ